jgi:hypothetical protein
VTAEGLDAFYSCLAYGEDALPDEHSHYDYYEGHLFIAPASRPLVITVGSGD